MQDLPDDEILNFLGDDGKTTREIAEEFKMLSIEVIAKMSRMYDADKVERISKHACKPSKWCKKNKH